MKLLAPRISLPVARRRLRRRRGIKIRAWLARTGAQRRGRKRHQRIELVRLPAYCVAFRVFDGTRHGEIELLVDAHVASVRRFTATESDWCESDSGKLFAPALAAAAARRAAHEQLLAILLREPGWLRQQPQISEASIELVQYPYWVYYWRRPSGMLDVRLLDAWTGELAGTKVRLAFLDALSRAAQPTPLDR